MMEGHVDESVGNRAQGRLELLAPDLVGGPGEANDTTLPWMPLILIVAAATGGAGAMSREVLSRS